MAGFKLDRLLSTDIGKKKKLTDIGLFGFSWIGKWLFSVDIG
jgi:hypothetical protein